MKINELTEFYVQLITDHAHNYLEHDEQLFRKLVRQLLDQYAVKREAENKAQQS